MGLKANEFSLTVHALDTVHEMGASSPRKIRFSRNFFGTCLALNQGMRPKLLAFHLLFFGCLSACLSGCYTQLYTQGYGTRALNSESDPPYENRLDAAGDTLLPADSLQSKTIIVNHYYQDRPYYRGYGYSDWDYPLISLGFYSSRYRNYNDPYWSHGSGYYHQYQHGYYGGAGLGSSGNSGTSGGTNGGTYHGSDPANNRVFTPPPSYPGNRKGKRSQTPVGTPAPAPATTEAPTPAPSYRSSESSYSDNSSSSANSNSGTGSGSGSGSSSSSSQADSHPALEKGKRR
jgi:hypothetical protein